MDGYTSHNTTTPDVETASDGYAARFRGPVGRWMLDVQERAVADLLAACGRGPLEILEVGGGHGQLADLYRSEGHAVTIHGSAPAALRRIGTLAAAGDGVVRRVVSGIWRLPFPDRSFDVVIAIRLLAHVEDWEPLLDELARVARRGVLVDYAPWSSMNILTPLLFRLKRRLEGNTRPYFCHRGRAVRKRFRAAGLIEVRTTRQFGAPMGLHRVLGRVGVSARIERLLAATRTTRVMGSPALLLARRDTDTDVATGKDQP